MELHSVWQGSFRLFGVDLQCHVLSGGQRIIEEASMAELLRGHGRHRSEDTDGAEMASFVKWIAQGPSALGPLGMSRASASA